MRQVVDLLPGALWPAIETKTKHAVAEGGLCTSSGDALIVTDAGIDFIVHRVSADTNNGEPVDTSFQNIEPRLYLGDIGPNHICLLNEHSIFTHHLLIVTRQFEPQDTLLRLRDFIALCACMREFDGLGFYNAGPDAGASQSHKHLQMLPLPLAGSLGLPIERAFNALSEPGTQIRNIPGLTFSHAFGRLSDNLFDDTRAASDVTYDLYVDMMEALGMRGTRTDGEFRQPVPYNLLLTRRWMLMIPRTKEFATNLSINALCYAGSFLVSSDTELAALKHTGPMNALTEAGRPRL